MQKKRNTPKKNSLDKSVEEISTDTTDHVDPFVLDHVNAFLQKFASLPKMEPFDLTSVDGAKDALLMLEERKNDLTERLKTVQVLKTLLKQ